jgi:hypothetical protein
MTVHVEIKAETAAKLRCIFTLDDDFYIYKIKGQDAFDVLKPDSV